MKLPATLHRLLFCFFIIFSKYDAVSQQSLYYEQFTSEKGLSENVVYCVLQDKRGFIWAGTHHGLNRFDGYSFRKFYSLKNDSTSLSQSEIYCMKEDAAGKFWIGTGLGLNYFDPITGKNLRIGFNGKIKNSDITDIHVLSKDSILVLVRNEVFLYTLTNDQWISIESSLPAMRIEKFFQFANNGVGFNFEGIKGFFVYDRAKNRFDKSANIPGTEIRPDHTVSSYFSDSLGNHFVFVRNRSIDVFNKNGDLVSRLDKKLFPSLDFVLMCNFFEAATGDVWIATTNGLLVYEPDKKKFNLIELIGDSRSLKGNKEMRAICIDKDQNLWLGVFGEGLLKCQISQNPFASISLDLLARKNAPRMIFGLYRWPDGEIAAETGFKNFTRIKNGKVTGFANSDSMSFERIIFISTGKKLRELSPAQFKITNKLFVEKRLFPSQFIFHDSNTVLLTTPRLIICKEDTVYYMKGSYSTHTVDDGEFYWSAATEGLVRVSKKDFSDTIYTYEPGNPFSLNENYIYHIVVDAKNNLWVGTKGGGLNFFDREENKFYHYTTKDGLPDDVIYFILPDKKGNLWLSTNRGLSRFNIKVKSFTNYSRRDGLLNSEFNRNGGLTMNDGSFYFSGTNGVDYFTPDDLEKTTNKSAVFFSGIKINGNEVSLVDAKEMKHFENNITVSFTANDFTRPDLVYYRYRLRDADEWTRVQGINSINYTALPDGQYDFTVQSSYDNFNWSNTAVHSFMINSPWWKTVWFYFSLAFVIAGLLYAFYRYRINQLKKIIHLRSKISQDLHDEVGATLSSIHVYSSVATMSLDKDVAKAKDALQHINTNTRQVMENMNDIVWAINTGQIGGATLEARLKNYGYELLTPMNIHCTYRIDKEADKKIENMEARKNILLIAKEAMNNIAKYSAATSAIVKLELDNRKLHLEITDDGNGFDNVKRRNGNGLNNMRQRAETLGGTFSCFTEKNEGTKIKCSIPLTNISD